MMPTPHRHPHARDERGVAMITVLIAMMVLIGFAVTIIDYAATSRTVSRRDQNWNAALNAAEAGVDDYLFHLNEASNYSQYDASNLPPDGNLAFKQYVPVPGGSTRAEYTYTPDIASLTTDGTITLTSTGRVGASKRTIQTVLRRRNFLDYLYFTDYETQDPAVVHRESVHGDRGPDQLRLPLLQRPRHPLQRDHLLLGATRSTGHCTPTTP